MAYTREQRAIIALSRRLSAGLPARVRQALFEAEAVESNFRNLHYGDRDSQGVLQQRPSTGWGPAGNAATDIRQFLQRALAVNRGFRGSAGQLAQAVQRSAFPGRYDEHAGEAARLLGGHGTGAVSQDLTMPAPTMSGPNLSSVKAQLAQSLISANQATSRGQRADYAPVLEGLTALHSAAEAPSSPPGTSITSLPGAPQAQGIAHFEGKPVAAWIAPILRRARAAGWRGTVESGYRSFADQSRIYASGVRPAAKPGTSNHEMTGFPGGAVDVTDAASLARILRRLGITALRWAGAKDPVHFSHPHAGHY